MITNKPKLTFNVAKQRGNQKISVHDSGESTCAYSSSPPIPLKLLPVSDIIVYWSDKHCTWTALNNKD
jgi:hypothetical protein